MPSIESVAGLVDWSRRHALAVLLAVLAVTLGAGFYAKTHLGFDTNTDSLLSEDLPWKQRQAVLTALFPDSKRIILVVLDAPTPDQADAGAAALAERLGARVDLFTLVRRPDGGPFFDRYGLLYLSPERLEETADRLIEAQGLIGALAADPSLRGLFDALALALEGLAAGEGDPARLEAALATLADTAEAALAGPALPLSWQRLLGGDDLGEDRLRRFLIVKPVLDYTRLRRGGLASETIRATALELGLTAAAGYRLRLTGEVPLSDEEFATLTEGAELTTALSLGLVTLILFLALRSWRIILPIVFSLVVGIVWSAAFAAATVGSLNLLSVAFAVLYIGLAVDFGIQLAVRYRDERHREADFAVALRRAARGVGAALLLAAGATAVDFYSFLPTDYRGISELGLVAGTSMIFGILLTLTLLPALLALLRPQGEPEPVGYAWAAPLDRFLLARRRLVLGFAAAIGLACFVAAFWLRFDYNPLNLKDPASESMATLSEVAADPLATPFTIDLLQPDLAAAVATGERLATLPEVGRVLTLQSFVPLEQEEKLAILDDLRFFMAPLLAPQLQPPPSPAEELAAAARAEERLAAYAAGRSEAAGAARLAAALRSLAAQPERLDALRQALVGGLPRQLEQLRLALSAGPVTLEELPADLRRSWVAPDGQARLQLLPPPGVIEGPALERFVEAVRALEPEAAGPAVSIVESGRTMLTAFEVARTLAVVVVSLLLLLVLRRLGDLLRVLAPLALAALLTLGTMVAIDLPFNFANFIALPLLVGIGVAFDIYLVLNWRAGQGQPLQSPTVRAVIFSALTTAAAFGSLALSPHPGTASLGLLLAIGLGWALVATLFFLPALLGKPPTPPARSRER